MCCTRHWGYNSEPCRKIPAVGKIHVLIGDTDYRQDKYCICYVMSVMHAIKKKNQTGKENLKFWGWGGGEILERVVREDFPEKVAFEGENHAAIWGKNFSGRGLTSAKALRWECAWQVWGIARQPGWMEQSEGENLLDDEGRGNGKPDSTGPSQSMKKISLLALGEMKSHWRVLSKGETQSWHFNNNSGPYNENRGRSPRVEAGRPVRPKQ